MVALWGVNLWAFAHSRVSYPKVFNIDPTNHLTQHDLWKVRPAPHYLQLPLAIALLSTATRIWPVDVLIGFISYLTLAPP